MVGVEINIQPEYYSTAEALIEFINGSNRIYTSLPKIIAIGGESGSGKSVTAVCLQQKLKEKNIDAYVFQMDDYFHLPPQSNHLNRVKSLKNVGMHEVDLKLLQSHIDAFLDGNKNISKPLVNFSSNHVMEEHLDLSSYSCLIVEGTYVLSLEKIDIKIFMEHSYVQTREQRMKRGRDSDSEFIESVLDLEHHLIRPYINQSDLIVKTDYSVELAK